VRDRHVEGAGGVEVADLVVSGEIRRSAFGMVTDRPMLSDTVRLDIRIRLEVGLAR
jgi:polyisoprenoid-binding protein YceI